ncbi:MAG: PilZ domain-containing protein [Bacteriovoracaceae bacterium]|nr:PilZ domain-containing protein [Bacteriovoracaceae bacterium]
MKIFICDPNNRLEEETKSVFNNKNNTTLVFFNDLNICMNEIIIEKPKILIIDISELGKKETGRIIDICNLYEIQHVLVSTNDGDLKEFEKTMNGSLTRFLSYTIYGEFLFQTVEEIKKNNKIMNILGNRLSKVSSRKYPILVKIIIVMLLVEPLMKIMYLWLITGYHLDKVFDNIIRIPFGINFMEFWFVFPLSGVLLLLFRKFLFFIFIMIQMYSILAHLSYQKFTWPYVSETPHVSSVILLILNILLVIYLLSSDEKKRFFDMTKAWWRQSPRYDVDWKCEIVLKDGSKSEAKVKNISLSGALVADTGHASVQDNFAILIQKDGSLLHLDATVVNHQKSKEGQWVGVNFVSLSRHQKVLLKNVIKSCF